ncbi:type I methionyl aminopeptidase [Candidatus Kaiserbacteria bacterium RIFCSPLOWO2_02_FULL_54_13]|uniref:Methionine aminopeptidase n=1 Tax=Candidatus Kaiserbacteria bacterium RIFCSPHIGHO2_02_FULL_54_22 TaxID=1798495 RepID=A0A1F6DK41_9BACT|nr:MAG: Methionine aminopeptidase [Parcubacteria group bacterium GW2011_GWA1_54_9]KKW42136.1 MAG: Methionine aminopeptidase [Parcubacteria group bacterium GW2011_GWB1_55_9]OGG61756.1 MAG: type I methionyl aminopeptidase [Candidatus Kaiserbacteria bacterium RIFCSPHIGHO2_02_FULL_54_22]OGG68323.1 MAG: type I methionyl aminopeptidase [Candidatus Kaiserbacteria bacterium RIFCSPHIGHO2_12_FULL_54_16]OGG83252.1 MAG: type I methionyl aminopeptidase [Candidatus Kaiserbacteria bacterium RIFCSPLOWO2_02_FUL
MIIANDTERENLIEGGKRLARVLSALRTKVAPGVTAEELDDLAEQLIREGGDTPCFLGYTPEGARRPYPAALCVSINDEVVHGIPNESEKVLKEGDIVGLDLGLSHNGVIVDAAITVPVGNVGDEDKKLLRATEAALAAGIAAAEVGKHIGDISHAIQKEIEGAGFRVVRELGGHSVGDLVHEDPFIPNFGRPGEGPKLVEGMVLALEPISSAGKAAVVLAPDGYTYRTKDGSRSAHFEHTILIEKGGARIITAS